MAVLTDSPRLQHLVPTSICTNCAAVSQYMQQAPLGLHGTLNPQPLLLMALWQHAVATFAESLQGPWLCRGLPSVV